jgi:cell wall-associated NlpC family hydrolase
MNDPLSDPRAFDLLSAEPDELVALVSAFRTAAEESHQTAFGLTAARDDGTWTGRAASAFRRAIGRLPVELDKVRAGFSAVADALHRYDAELTRIKSEFVHIVGNLTDAQNRLGPARSSAKTAADTLKTTVNQHGVKVQTLTGAELAVARADGTVGDLVQQIHGMRSRAFALLDEFQTARETCRSAIHAARSTAPVQPQQHTATVVDPSGPLGGHGHNGNRGGHARRGHHGSGGATGGGTGNISDRAAREKVATMIKTARSLIGTPYVYGGGHGAWGNGSGLDCSGFVSAVLHSAGYLNAPQTTEGFAAQPGIAAGHGHYVTIYDRTNCGANEHVIIDLNGTFYEEGGGSADGGGPSVHRFTPSASYLASFNTVLHPVGL